MLKKGSMLSIIIPCYNEAHRLSKTLESVLFYLNEKKEIFELILVDDGSLDETLKQIQPFLQNEQIRLISYQPNRGKGYAVKKGVQAARGETILFMDADLATPIEELEHLEPFVKDHDIVIGSRYLQGSQIQRKQPLYRRILGRWGNVLIQAFLLPGIQDTQCGFKLFRTQVAKDLFKVLKTDRFGFDFEILYRAKNKGYSIHEESVSWLHHGNSRLRPIRDAFRTLADLRMVKKQVESLDNARET